MSKELSPKYNPAEVEAGRYQKWLDADVFKPSGDQKAKPYSIVIPPPNVTGKLYLGHALGGQPSKQTNHKKAEIYH